jgi:hypothetical protein
VKFDYAPTAEENGGYRFSTRHTAAARSRLSSSLITVDTLHFGYDGTHCNALKRSREGEQIEHLPKALQYLELLLSIDPDDVGQALQDDCPTCERVKAHLEACQRSVLQVFLDHQMAKNAATFPVEIVRRVAASSFLEPLELSRFLLRTTRSFRKGLEEDELYKYLCHARWKTSSELPPSLAEAKGYKWLYSKLSSSYQRGNFNEGQTPAQAAYICSGEKLAGLVSVLSDNKEVVTYSLEIRWR